MPLRLHLVFKLMKSFSGYQLLDSGSLRIEHAEIRDSGIYVCIAQNNAGTDLGQVRLEVQG